MNDLIRLHKIYKQTNFSKLFVSVFTKKNIASDLLFDYTVISIYNLLILLFTANNSVFLNVSGILMIIWMVLFYIAFEQCHVKPLEQHKELMSFYYKDRRYLRFMIFKEKFKEENSIDNINIELVEKILDTELNVLDAQPIISSFFAYALLTSIITIIGVYLSTLTSKPFFPLLIGLLLAFLVFILYIFWIVRTSLKDRRSSLSEFSAFLKMLSHSKT